MSSRQERELAMRTRMIVALAQVVQVAREFVEAQSPLAHGDFAGDLFVALERKLNALTRNDWAREMLDSIEKAMDEAGRG